MSGLVSWVLSILGVVLTGTLIDLLLTKSRLKAVVRSVFATVTVLVVVTPLPSLVHSGGEHMFDFDMTDRNFLEYASDLKIRTLESAVERALLADGFETKVSIVGHADADITIESVTIILSETGILGDGEHIHKYDSVRDKAAAYLNVDKDRVTVQ